MVVIDPIAAATTKTCDVTASVVAEATEEASEEEEYDSCDGANP